MKIRSKKLCGILLSLSLAFSLLPGMSLTAYAAGTVSDPISINTWNDLTSKLSEAAPSGETENNPTYYKLTDNVTDSANQGLIKVENGRYIVLDLNGYTIDRRRSNPEENGRVFNIYGNLTITGNGTITGGNNIGNGGGVWVNGGKLTMEGGTISGNAATGEASNGGGVFVGTGTFIMKGGTISNNTATYGGGVYAANDCAFEMTGGKISENTANINGGGVYVSCMSTMNNGEISGNKAPSGAGVYLFEDGIFNMKDGKISGNSATNDGGGVYVNRGSSSTFNDKKGAFNMTGGSVTGNTAERDGGGVYVYGMLNLSGAVNISGNNSNNGTNNVTFDGSRSRIQIGEKLSHSKPIGVSFISTQAHHDLTSGYTTTMGTDDPTKFFVSENTGYGVSLNQTTKEVRLAELASVTKDPAAKTLTYTGSAQALVTAGEARGGTMHYALGTKDAATEEYKASIPEKTNAGTYYVWYKAVGDDNHTDSNPACVTVTIQAAAAPTAAPTAAPATTPTEEPAPEFPKTGDTTDLALWLLLTILGLGAAAFLLRSITRKGNR